jgi:hypothetical protein
MASDPLRVLPRNLRKYKLQSLQNVTSNFMPLGVMRDGLLTPSNNPRDDVGVNAKASTVSCDVGHGSGQYNESITRRT